MEKKDPNQNDVIGFKELMDDIELPNKSKSRQKSEDHSYKMHTFLEYESNRLSKILDFYDMKILGLKNYPQSEKIHFDLEQELLVEKKLLIQKLKWKKSPLSQNLQGIFKIHF